MISKHKLFLLIFLPAFLALITGIALIQQKTNELSTRQFELMLKNQWQTLAALNPDKSSYEELAELTKETRLRITLVSADGHVIIDSSGQESRDSHAEREEIRSAVAGIPMVVIRYSKTTGTHTIYYAEKLDNGDVLRVSYPAEYYGNQKTEALRQATIGILVLIGLVGFFAVIISGKMNNTFKDLGESLNAARNGRADIATFNNIHLDTALASLSSATRELKIKNDENISLNARLEYILDKINEGVILLKEGEVLYHNAQAEEILGHDIPANVNEIRNKEMIAIFEQFMHKFAGEIKVKDNIIHVDSTIEGDAQLIILHNISDGKKYSYYKADLVGNISHELKTPLALIMGSTETILESKDMPPEFAEKLLQVIYKNSYRMNAIIDDLIFLHQLERTLDTDNSETDINELVSELSDMHISGDKTVTYDINAAKAKIQPAHLTSILTNLITNAAKYSTGNVIDVSITKTLNLVDIRVADLGAEIPPAERKRIFERFYSVSKSRSRENSGSGLGLSIVKHIAKLYKGRVSVESNEKGGNTFIVQLVEK